MQMTTQRPYSSSLRTLLSINLSYVLLLIPPLTRLNTPYPATAYLTGFLRQQNIAATQGDLGLDLVLEFF